MTDRAWPITRRNSTVLGSDARCPGWDLWWDKGANWADAVPTRGDVGCLHVLCHRHEVDGVLWWDGTEYFRVRPKNDRGRPVKIDGVWHWRYPA